MGNTTIADPPRPWSLSDAWREGRTARERGELDDTNPYSAGPLRVAWFLGWDGNPLPVTSGGQDTVEIPAPRPGKHSAEIVSPRVAWFPRTEGQGRHHLIVSHHKAA